MLLSMQQKMRINRMNKERHYLLDRDINSYAVSGSTGIVYTVTVNTDSITCSCPDMTSWAVKYNCVCKHCCFVLLKVRKHTESELAIIIETKHVPPHMVDLQIECNPIYRERYLKLKTQTQSLAQTDFSTIYKDLIKLDCPVCFDELINVKKVVTCPCCQNSIHTNCMEKWLKTHETCVLCRSDIWKHYKNINVKNINVYTAG